MSNKKNKKKCQSNCQTNQANLKETKGAAAHSHFPAGAVATLQHMDQLGAIAALKHREPLCNAVRQD